MQIPSSHWPGQIFAIIIPFGLDKFIFFKLLLLAWMTSITFFLLAIFRSRLETKNLDITVHIEYAISIHACKSGTSLVKCTKDVDVYFNI
jgi:hypothetical protein